MRKSMLAIAILTLCLGGYAVADGNGRDEVYELVKGHRHGRFSIFNTKHGTLMLDTNTGHTWRLEFQDRKGYSWSQIPRGIMKDPEFAMPDPATGSSR